MRRVLALAAGLLLAGCVTAPLRVAAPVPLTYESRRSQLQAVHVFTLEGRLAAAVGQEGFNASLDWAQQGRRSALNLRAPLGFGTAQVLRDGEHLSLKSSRGDHYDGTLAREALARQLGFDPPLDSLRYWVLGVPDPALPATETPDAAEHLAALEQDGWRVEFAEYRRYGEAALEAVLPRRLTLLREGIRLRLVIDRWTVAAP